jgi:type IV secretion system protein VirB1
MTITLATLMMTCAPLVHPTTLRALIEVESGGNPYAVSINHPQTLKDAGTGPPPFAQPHSAREARGLTQRLLAQGLGVSVGLAQINVEHLAEHNLRIADLFDPCINLVVAQRVLLECDASQSQRIAPNAGARLGRTLLCYNAGDYVTGRRNHYASTVMRAAVRHLYRGSRPTRSPA